MSDHDDPVDAVILAFLDHVEGSGARPTLDHLAEADRHRAVAILDGLLTARGIDPRATRPSVESLLADTPLATLLPASSRPATLDSVGRLLATVDSRARIDLDDDVLVYSYLDLRARFLLVPNSSPVVTSAVRVRVQQLFDADPDTSRVGVVAARGDELLTQMLAADDLADTITTPRGEPHLRWEPVLPLMSATRSMLEQRAPEWPPFDFDHAGADPLDLPSMVGGIARSILAREAARSYRGEKRRAYKELVGRESAFVELVVRVFAQGTQVDLDGETTRILRAAA
jgi:hypothetical protein